MSHQHKLDVIYRKGGEGGMDVVRWCRECGAVAVDHDVDGRVHAGNIMPMRFPSLRGIHLQANRPSATGAGDLKGGGA